jgi:hypothetical protein
MTKAVLEAFLVRSFLWGCAFSSWMTEPEPHQASMDACGSEGLSTPLKKQSIISSWGMYSVSPVCLLTSHFLDADLWLR